MLVNQLKNTFQLVSESDKNKTLFKRVLENYNSYKNIILNNKKCDTLEDVYTTFSCNKYIAFLECEKIKNNFRGKKLKIISNNCNVFSVGFLARLPQGDYFCYITRYNKYCMLVK